METLHSLSIQIEEPQTVNYAAAGDNWMTLVTRYLKDDVLPEDKKKVRLLRLKVAYYMLYDDQFYKRGFSTLLLKCVDLEQENHILQEIHEGIYDNHRWGEIPSPQGLKNMILLANNEDRHHDLHDEVRQMPEIL